jgi:hypothetical protein
MTATYTANLASFFVETTGPTVRPTSIEHAVRLGLQICTQGVPNAIPDAFSNLGMILDRAPGAQMVLRPTDETVFQALNDRKCDVAAVNKDSFLRHEKIRAFNPDCDLEWVGRAIETIESGFAAKADAGYLCTSLIRDVLDLHLIQMIGDGTLAKILENEFARHDDNHCADDNDDDGYGDGQDRRQLTIEGSPGVSGVRTTPSKSMFPTTPSKRTRKLKSSSSAASSSGAEADTGEALTMHEMLGTFVLHWSVMLGALLLAAVTKYKKRLLKNFPTTAGQTVLVRYRNNGPIIGTPPRLNTYVMKGVPGEDEADEAETDEQKADNSHCDIGNGGLGGMNNFAAVGTPVDISNQQWFKELQEDMRASRAQQAALLEEIRASRRQQEEMAKQMGIMIAWIQKAADKDVSSSGGD